MMTPRKRIRKKDLKEDKLVTFYVQTRKWVDDNIQYISIGAAAVLVVLLGALLLSGYHAKAEQAAGVEFSKATRLFQAADYRGAARQFSTIVDSYGQTRSGKLARFYLAQSLYQTADYAGAAKQFRKAASALSADPQLKASALAGEAASVEQQGNLLDAAQKYETVVAKFKDNPRAAYYLLRAARCYELADNTAKALSLYQRIF